MRVLIAVGTSPDTTWLQRAVALLPAATTDLLLLHILDSGPREEWEHARGRFPARAPLRPERRAAITEAERQHGEVLLARAEGAVREAGYSGPLARQLMTGRPEQAIVSVAESAAGVIQVRARDREARAPAGPASVGHVARFVLDHAGCPVLLLRGAIGRP